MSYPQQTPGTYPPPGQPGQYPPPGQPGQYPPPGQPGQYPPPGQPGQYPPPGQPGQYPPPGQPGQYPPPGQPGQYPPPGQPGQYPPSGHYPPQGQPGQYPPSGYPAPGGGGAYPPSGYPAQPGGHHPSASAQPGQGWDGVDSDPEDYIRSKDSKYPVRVKFVNKTQKKLKLFWVDHKGKFKKAGKIKEGRIEVIDSYEGHKFVADTKKGSPTVINGNMMYIVHATPGSSGEVKAEITTGPKDIKHLRSYNGQPTRVKFSNRTHEVASIDWVDTNGSRKHIKDIPPKRAWTYDSSENHVFVAYEKGHKSDELALNYGWFWKVNKSHNPQFVQKIMITEDMDDSSSSSSSSD